MRQVEPKQYRPKPWLADILALGVLAAAVLIFFLPVVVGQAWIPKGGGDSVSFLYPMYRFAAQSFQAGVVPLWNPHQYAGTSFIGDNQSGIFYPFNFLLFLIDPDFSYRTMQGLILWHFFFAGVTMYGCLRLLRPHEPVWRPAALAGALAFMFSGVFITHIGNLNLIAVAAWLPLVFLALHRSITANVVSRRLVWAVAGGAALGVATLAGHGQMTFMLAAFLSLYAVYRVLADRTLWPLLLLGVLAVTAAALAAVNILPSYEGLAFTIRSGFAGEQATNYSMPWRALWGLLAPDYYGRGSAHFWGGWSRVEYGYVGILTLFLAALTPFVRRSRITLFFMIAVLLFLLLALGENTPLYPALLRSLPVFPFQVPARFVLLVDFSLAGLAAISMDAFDRRPRPIPLYFAGSGLLFVGGLALLLGQYQQDMALVPHHQQQMARAILFFALYGSLSWLLLLARGVSRLRSRLFGLLALLLLATDLISLGYWVELEHNDPRPGFAENSPALAYLKADPGLHRIDIAQGIWQPNLPQIEGLYAIKGVYNPLQLANYNTYIGSVGFRGSPLYNLLGVKYVVGGKDEPPADTNIIVPVYDEDERATIYLNTRAMPRVNLLYNARILSTPEDVFAAVHEATFDPSREVILQQGEGLLQGEDVLLEGLQQEPGEATINVLRYDANNAAFEVITDKRAYLLLSDIYHPHWRATVNGAESPILPANYALRAVPLEAGRQVVEMWYDPPGWRWGSLISAVTLSLLLAAAVAWIVYRRKLGNN